MIDENVGGFEEWFAAQWGIGGNRQIALSAWNAALSAHGENASVQTPVVDEAMAQKFWDGYEQYFVDLSADELFDGKDRKIEAAMSALTAALTGG